MSARTSRARAAAEARSAGDRSASTSPCPARWLSPQDDVATALADLPAGARVPLASGTAHCEVVLAEAIALGHKFAVRALGEGLRIRKYGEFIGRTTAPVVAGAWVHEHNLATAARHDPRDEAAWRDARNAEDVVAVGTPCTTVGESPVYDALHDRLWWIDVRGTPAIHRLDLASGSERSWPLGEDIGSLALLAGEGERLVAGLRSGFALFDAARGTFAPLVDPEASTPQTRMNDGKCDTRGRFWCGSANPESGIPEGRLYRLDAQGGCVAQDGAWYMPNGIAWPPDDRIMVMADSRRGCIFAWDFEAGTGTLGARRVFADLGAYPGVPDGATFDAEGFLWSAQFGGACLLRLAPDGRIDRVLRLPVSRPTSLAFGGAGHRRLYVTTATRGLDAAARAREPLAGRVLAIDAGVGGMAPMRFGPVGNR